jgi:hypothetical protein
MHRGCSNPLDDDAGGIHGEFGTLVNADNYAIFALSIYFQESFSSGEVFEPWGDWRDIPKWATDPVRRKNPSITWDNPGRSLSSLESTQSCTKLTLSFSL